MQRFFNIVEGEGQGQSKPFTSALMIVGRAQEAEIHIEDSTNKVSRRHLQVRVEEDVVFVENMSPFGTLLNGAPLNGIVSLQAGDILKIGEIKLCYEEKAARPAAPRSASLTRGVDSKSDDPDATKVADSAILAAQEKDRQKERESDAGGTRVAAEEHTRMMDPNELGRVRLPPIKKKPSTASPWVGIVLVLVVAALGGTFWFLRHKAAAGSVETIPCDDHYYSFHFSYPANWTRTLDATNATEFGLGQEGDANMARVKIYHDKNPDHAITGLTYGFFRYKDELKKQFPGFELEKSEKGLLSGAMVIYFHFKGTKQKGEGLFLSNGDSLLVLECFCPIGAYEHFRPVFESVCNGFHLTGDGPQKYIDFEMPDAAMMTLANTSSAELTNQINDHMAKGNDLLKSSMVKLSYLSLAMREYSQALRLSLAGPDPLPSWRPAAQGLDSATQQFNAAVANQQFLINIALRDGDWERAATEAQRLLEMYADHNDPGYRKAYKNWRNLSKGRR